MPDARITRLEWIPEIDTTETTDEDEYVLTTFSGYAWRDDDCGLVWDRKGRAEGCSAREHVASYTDSYFDKWGVEAAYERSAIRTEVVAKRPASAPPTRADELSAAADPRSDGWWDGWWSAYR